MIFTLIPYTCVPDFSRTTAPQRILTSLPLLLSQYFPHRDGAGILVSRDVYEGIRQAQPSDVRTVEEIIRPLEEQVPHLIAISQLK